MMNHERFAVFILSHGRAGNIKTLRPLLDVGNYSGNWYIVLDNEDESADKYKSCYGENRIIIFDRPSIIKKTDPGTNDKNSMGVVFARNACWDIAESLGLEYFLMLEDDYLSFEYRYPLNGKLMVADIKNLDRLFDTFLDFLETSKAATVAMAQGGDFIGGLDSGTYRQGIKRKAMNTFFCMTSRRIWFMGKNNDDCTTYVTLGNRGVLFMTYTKVAIRQEETQKQKGGMSEFFKAGGAGFIKPFTTVIYAPQAVKVSAMGVTHKRFHHFIEWGKCVPKIINEKWRKGGAQGAERSQGRCDVNGENRKTKKNKQTAAGRRTKD